MLKSEKETIINWNEDSQRVTIYSCSAAIWNRCEKAGMNQTGFTKDSRGKINSKTFEGTRKNILIRKVPAAKILTDEEREVLRERMRNIVRPKMKGGGHSMKKDKTGPPSKSGGPRDGHGGGKGAAPGKGTGKKTGGKKGGC